MSEETPGLDPRRHSHRKQILRGLLAERDLDTLMDWMAAERNPMRPLSSLLFDSDELLRWRAIEALGLAAAQEARRDPERVRRQVRRLFWLMNDESGGICWNAPEAIAEILYNVPQFIEEYGLQLPAFFVEEPFERGSRWAVARLAGKETSALASAGPALAASLKDADSVVRGLSLLALTALRDRKARAGVEALTADDHQITLYDFASGTFVSTTVAELAEGYLASL